MRKVILYIFISLSFHVAGQETDYNSLSFWSGCQLQNLENINTSAEEFSPTSWGEYLIFIGKNPSNRSKKSNVFDINATILSEGIWQEAFTFNNSLQSNYHEGPVSWLSQDSLLYFTSSYIEEGEAKSNLNNKTPLQIYRAKYSKGEWIDISRLPFGIGEENYCHPSINILGNRIILASDHAMGEGKMDLYLSQKDEEGNWGEMLNMGAKINSSSNQWFPYLHQDKHLFYASDQEDGRGLDIYYCLLDVEGNVLTKLRLPQPINSEFDDFGLSFKDDRTAYLSSNRPGGKGKDDLYEVVIPLPEESSTSEPQEEISTIQKSMIIKVRDRQSKKSIESAQLRIFVFEGEAADNFTLQMNNNLPVSSLEIIANNTGDNIDYSFEKGGILSLNLPANKQIFMLVKHISYHSDWNFIQTRQNISEMVFELDKQ